MFEVERKFNANDAALRAILDLGAVQTKENRTFTDVYYDTNNNCLTENNFWLRQRDLKWELKSPADQRSPDEKLFNSSFRETEQESDITKLILPVLKKHSGTTQTENIFKNLLDCLEHFMVVPFSTIVTHRKSYRLGEFIIDLDTTDTGFSVGEIELLLSRQDQIEEGSQKIDALITKLGLPVHERVAGKMGHFLKMNRTQHYNRLYELKILI